MVDKVFEGDGYTVPAHYIEALLIDAVKTAETLNEMSVITPKLVDLSQQVVDMTSLHDAADEAARLAGCIKEVVMALDCMRTRHVLTLTDLVAHMDSGSPVMQGEISKSRQTMAELKTWWASVKDISAILREIEGRQAAGD